MKFCQNFGETFGETFGKFWESFIKGLCQFKKQFGGNNIAIESQGF